MTKNAGIEQRASKTAMFAAVHRYLSLFESNPELSSQDTLAGLFISRLWKFLLGFAWCRRHVRQNLHNKVPGTYPYVIARTKCFDERFVSALQARVPQIVILGAGYDTRAIRYQSQNYGSRVYELDTGLLQSRKKAIFERNSVAIPDYLTFCPITFGKDTLADVLHQAGYDSTQKTLFLWEGVTYYLTESAVLKTFAFIENSAVSGSELLFDYFYKSFIDGRDDYPGAKELFSSVRKVGEPFLFGIDQGGLEEFLSTVGFSVVERYCPQALEQRYLTSNGETLGKVYGFAECVQVRLKQREVA